MVLKCKLQYPSKKKRQDERIYKNKFYSIKKQSKLQSLSRLDSFERKTNIFSSNCTLFIVKAFLHTKKGNMDI